MHIHSPAEKPRATFVEIADGQHRADTRDSRQPKPVRDVAPGECWAFTDYRSLAEIMAEGPL
jgi:hypothetical protein